MDWIQLIGAFGLGTIVTQLLNIFLTHRITQESEYRRWIRDNKLVAFAAIAEEMLSLGFSQKEPWNPFAAYAKAARVLLFLEDEELAKHINKFIEDRIRLATFLENDLGNTPEAKELYIKLYSDSNALIGDLRKNLLNPRNDITDNTKYILTSAQWYIVAGVIFLTIFVIWLIGILQ
ncbi:MAG: hypothetical protein HYR94_14435 [Chloroflexi bacterium]|nr:hypothetical protein [Chloroflexota bacterium]